MADDLDLAMRTTRGDDPSDEFVAALRERLLSHANTAATSPDIALSDADVEWRDTEQENQTMSTSRWVIATVAAAIVALVIALSLVGSNNRTNDDIADEPNTVATIEPSRNTEPPQVTSPPATAPPSAGTPGVDTDAGCELDTRAMMTATPDDVGESVTIDVTSDAACSGVEVKVVATPWSNGFAIERTATLDSGGAATVSDHLLGTRNGEQRWTVELLVVETGGVATTTEFEVTGLCDLDNADLQATYLPATDEVDIVLQVDPLCAGSTFTFDNREIFASSPPGGWATYTVDETGRIEVTEVLDVDLPVIDVFAIPVAEDGGINTGFVARVTLEVDP